MQIQKYPVGKQDFPKIRNENFVYVDKTKYILELAILGGSFFLSKPRRFGKSLFLSTLESVFLGKKELFESLYIYDKWEFVEFPIIRIDFNALAYENDNLEKAIDRKLLEIGVSYDLDLQNGQIKDRFQDLIKGLSQKFQRGVVILIDEYDKPLIDYLNKDDLHQALANRKILKSFYSVLKPNEAHIKLLFITGVTKFSKVSIFSDLNNLKDLSLKLQFNEICGISQKELETNFSHELTKYDKEKIKQWYNGYKFHPKGESVYNPFSLLSFFDSDDFNNFWYNTGTPTFLMKMCREQHMYQFEEVSINRSDLGNFDIENLQILPILFQTGYLTITGENPLLRIYKLSFPNQEVRESYLRNLADAYIDSRSLSSSIVLEKLLKSLQTQNSELLKDAINEAFAHIPYSLWQKENEQYYHALVHLLFSLLGVYIFSEVQTQHGRSDAIVIYENQIYCLEFKLDQSAQMAIDQMKERGYAERYLSENKPVHFIGINFSSKDKAVEEIRWER